MIVLRTLGLAALAALILGAALISTGFSESSRRAMDRQNGVHEIPHDSALVRATLAAPLGDDVAAVDRAIAILQMAKRDAEAAGLQAFFGRCNAERVLGRDDACRSETVAGAAAKGAALPKRPAEPTPAEAETNADLARALSFFLPGEDTLRDATGENTWRNNRYEAPGVVVYGSPVDGAYLFIAARNAGSRAIVNLEARFALALPNGARLDLECGPRNPYPFATRRLTAGAAAPIACRRPDGVPVADLVAAMRAADAAAPAVRIVGFELRDPAAAVVARGDAAAPRFAIGPSETLFREGRDFDPAAPPKSLPAELADMDCATLATCPTPYQALAMAVERPFDLHPLLLAPTIGVLLGLVVGGFARRAFTWGGVLAALLVLIAAVGIALLFQSVSSGGGENGFALMAIAALMAGALLGFGAGLPAFFVTIALLAALRSRLEPAAERAPP